MKKEYIITGSIIVLLTYTLGLSLVSQTLTAPQTSRTVSSTGSILTIGVGVYVDASCSTPVTSIPWGTLEPGQSQDIICFIKNEGTSKSTLTMYTCNWSPSDAGDYLNLSWDYSGVAINAGAVAQVTFTLNVDSSIQDISNFSFDITIVGTSS
jgi:hypothetical protein